MARFVNGSVEKQEPENYPIANSMQHKHGDIVKCPSCGAIGCLDCSPDGGLSFANGIWEEQGEWFCVECCYNPTSTQD